MRRLLLAVLLAASVAGCTLADVVPGSGSPAKDLVSGAKYPKLIVEIDHPQGYAPTDHAVQVLRAALDEVTGKTSIDVKLQPGIPVEKDKKYTDAELRSLRAAHQSHETGGDTYVLHVLYVAGGYSADSSNSRVLGLASEGGPITMFKGNIRQSASGGVFGIGGIKEENIERAVLVHEFGHAAGLVNFGADMVTPHEDPDHRGHSSNKESVMWHQIETSAGLQELLSGGSTIPYQFDANDKADLKALREG